MGVVVRGRLAGHRLAVRTASAHTLRFAAWHFASFVVSLWLLPHSFSPCTLFFYFLSCFLSFSFFFSFIFFSISPLRALSGDFVCLSLFIFPHNQKSCTIGDKYLHISKQYPLYEQTLLISPPPAPRLVVCFFVCLALCVFLCKTKNCALLGINLCISLNNIRSTSKNY